MIIYLAKFVLCSGLFFVAYLFLLEKEKVHQFKRFYLLISLFLSLTIPLLTFQDNTQVIENETVDYLNIVDRESKNLNTIVVSQTGETNILPYLITGTYATVTILLLLRFLRNIHLLLAQVRRGKKSSWHGEIIILNKKSTPPYSFLNYIFVSKNDYENNKIANEILLHELTHVRQKHSFDVILIEIMQVFLWFNPILYFYRNAIQTNHEYLADESVIQFSQDISTYQLVLLQHISTQSGLKLSSQFNYLTIKKRLTMMTKTTSMKAVLGKQLLLIPVLGLALFLFSTKTVAQEKSKKSTNSSNNRAVVSQDKIPSTKDGITESEMKAYKEIEDKYLIISKDGKHKVWANKQIPNIKKELMKKLYFSMSKAQHAQTTFAFIKSPKPLPAVSPTSDQFAKLKDKSVYGIWIDDKKVPNTDLANYKAEDFKQIYISKLYGKAKEGKTYKYQADLMTKKYYDDYYMKNRERSDKYIMVTKHYSELSK